MRASRQLVDLVVWSVGRSVKSTARKVRCLPSLEFHNELKCGYSMHLTHSRDAYLCLGELAE